MMRWPVHVAHMGEIRNAYKILVGNLKGRDHSEDLGVEATIILEWMLMGIGWKVMVWIYVVQDKNQWRSLVHTVINLRVP
jgi:hypothetical protein